MKTTYKLMTYRQKYVKKFVANLFIEEIDGKYTVDCVLVYVLSHLPHPEVTECSVREDYVPAIFWIL